MPETQLIATDIDYTLTDADLRLDTAAVEKIRELEMRGDQWEKPPGDRIARATDRHIRSCRSRERWRDR
jgi:hypothetical protein